MGLERIQPCPSLCAKVGLAPPEFRNLVESLAEVATMKKWMQLGAWFLAILGLVTAISCNKDDAQTPEETQQEITEVRLVLTKVGTLEEVVLVYRDADGNGGEDAVIEGGTLDAGTVYFSMIEEIQNETVNPVQDVKALIENDNQSYQIFYQPNQIDVSLEYADRDDGGFPIGLFTAITTGVAGDGSIIISIVESPNKTASGVAEGLIANAGGRTLVQMNFPISIE